MGAESAAGPQRHRSPPLPLSSSSSRRFPSNLNFNYFQTDGRSGRGGGGGGGGGSSPVQQYNIPI